MLASRGIDVSRVRVSRSAHVIMPYHVALDVANEARLGDGKVGTTGRGIGPTYGDRAWRLGLRMEDLLDRDVLRERIARALPDKNLLLDGMGGPTLRGRPAGRGCARLGRPAARPPRRHHVAGPGGARARRARPARGRAGHAARPRPRELSVRDLVEPGRRRRVHGWRDRPAPGRRGHRRDEGLLDAGRLGAVPDRAPRRDRRRDRLSAATSSGRSPGVRGGSAGSTPCRCAMRWRSTASAASCSTSSTSCRASRRSGCASPTSSTAGGSRRGRRAARRCRGRRRSTTSSTAGTEPINDVRSLADLPENARRYVSAIEEHAGVPIVLVSVGPERTQTIERAWRPMRNRAGLPA